ncbi:MAG: Fe-S oxidoreductase [Candidatus Brocadiaceae bacterium]|nr:Fe-S oxidoreductase [Candidatus Brocadiaceae bacterium]
MTSFCNKLTQVCPRRSRILAVPAIIPAQFEKITRCEMNVFLLQPPSAVKFFDNIYLNEPLALEYLAAGLKMDGHSVIIHDARLEPDYQNAFIQMKPDVVGITGVTIQVKIIRRIAEHLKSLRPDIRIVVGGHHATMVAGDFNSSAFDAVVIGEGVNTLREIVSCWEKKIALNNIKGVAIPGDKMHFTEKRPLPDLNDFPFPDRSLTRRYRKCYFNEWLRPVATVRTSLGCSSRCEFCSAWASVGGNYLRRKPELIVEEIKTIKERNIYFADDETLLDAKRMHHLADLIRDAGIKKNYYCFARVDTVVRHPELLAKWHSIGLETVFIGFESFSDERLKAMKKNVSIDQQSQAVKILNQVGIFIYAQFVVDPAFDYEDFKALLAYIHGLKLKYASFTILTPLPGTELYLKRKHDLQTDNPELFDVFHAVLPTKLLLQEFYREFARLYENVVSKKDGLRFLMKHGFWQAIRKIRHGSEFITLLRNTYRDHGDGNTCD